MILASLAATILLAAPVPALAERTERPLIELAGGRELVLVALPDILSLPEVKPHLGGGLTTSFVLEVAARDDRAHKVKGRGMIEVRYELWDEVYLVTATAYDGRRWHESLSSVQRLLAWWKGIKLPLGAAGPLAAGRPWRLDLELSVIPFSQSEQHDTQRWFSRSLGDGQSGTEPAGRPAGAGGIEPGGGVGPASAAAPLHGVLDLLIATSIKRRSLVSYNWSLILRPESGAEHRP
ncbi:MAG TPA: hypothetical protein VHR45_05435 [Thermoanaerobaculia bacterium]|nr:hypothetical protein [Thermoanaerobaculia bacterium]